MQLRPTIGRLSVASTLSQSQWVSQSGAGQFNLFWRRNCLSDLKSVPLTRILYSSATTTGWNASRFKTGIIGNPDSDLEKSLHDHLPP